MPENEPAIYVTLIAALLGLAASFGLNLTADQTKAIMAVVTILAGLVIRQKVTPTKKA